MYVWWFRMKSTSAMADINIVATKLKVTRLSRTMDSRCVESLPRGSIIQSLAGSSCGCR